MSESELSQADKERILIEKYGYSKCDLCGGLDIDVCVTGERAECMKPALDSLRAEIDRLTAELALLRNVAQGAVNEAEARDTETAKARHACYVAEAEALSLHFDLEASRRLASEQDSTIRDLADEVRAHVANRDRMTALSELSDARWGEAEREVERLKAHIREANENAPHALVDALDSLTKRVGERDEARREVERMRITLSNLRIGIDHCVEVLELPVTELEAIQVRHELQAAAAAIAALSTEGGR